MIPLPPSSTLFPYTTLFRSPPRVMMFSVSPSAWSAQIDARIERDRKEHTSELQSLTNLVCRLLLEKKKKIVHNNTSEPSKTQMITSLTPRVRTTTTTTLPPH